MTILVDDAIWWFRERKWCHMVSDESLEELHAFAERLGIPQRGFQGDHYDLPEDYRNDAIGLGAREVSARELLRRLQGAGLRLPPAARRARFGPLGEPEGHRPR